MEPDEHKEPPRTEGPSPSRADTGDRTLTTYKVGALPLVNAVLSRLDLGQALRTYLPPDDRRMKVPTWKVLLLIVRNLLLSREPVYGIPEWAAQYALDHVGLDASELAGLNDDRIGRCLDRLFDGDRSTLLLDVVRRVVKDFGINLDELHNDSTTVTFFGEYRDWSVERRLRAKPTQAITYGHNKDHRPDLKQLLFLLTTTADGVVPVHFDTLSGNTTDDRTHQDTWRILCGLRGGPDFLYVGDCKLATAENMNFIQERGGRFVSVLPRTRREDRDFRGDFDPAQAKWYPIANSSKNPVRDKKAKEDCVRALQPARTTSEGFRLLWVHSSRKQEQDQMTRWSRIESALTHLEELRKRLASPRTRYRTREVVERALDAVRLRDEGIHRFLTVQIEEIEEEEYKQARPGRPNDHTPYRRVVRKRFDLRFEVNRQELVDAARTDGFFPLVTNDDALTPEAVYQAYKRQPRLEKRFSQFKSQFHVAPVFLKNGGRIEALLCLYFFALLVESLIEREIRNAMSASRIESLPLYPEGRASKRPCARRLFDIFDNVYRHVLTSRGPQEAQSERRDVFHTELSALQRNVLEFLGLPPEVCQ
jgi:transposase